MRLSYTKKKTIYTITATIILVVIFVLAWPRTKPQQQAAKTAAPANKITASVPPAFDKNAYSTDVANSLWAVVNKGRMLPSSYVPANLVTPTVPLRYPATNPEMHVRADAAAAMQTMFAAAKQSGIGLKLASGYRSYANQTSTYSNYVKTYGVSQADTFSARPGHSEHQTGLAADLEPVSGQCEIDQCFGDLPEGKWLAANDYKYGFIIRYQKDTQNLTGYEYEPWHVRYLGTALSNEINSSGQTLEQFFALPPYTTYPTSSLTLKM
ncbi:M15 family metallopeptidase [Candidatus Saccharibacteria bacterium]|nr:M15 family metallopeptidase [Candidatus Saccharibacteria bacterium]